jgi:hypothetical protein
MHHNTPNGLETTIPYINRKQTYRAENIYPPNNHINNTVKRRHTTTQPRLRYKVLRYRFNRKYYTGKYTSS